MSNKKYKVTPNIAQLKLEAIFHPKFDNESSSNSTIRQKMLHNVSTNKGYIETSLKHSGSLLLWSGKQCFYSKNSTNNIFTKVGEILLMQHFIRCFDATNWREEYKRCSEYIHENRITCSFEVVTSILGHHGDLPNKDYLILIAVANRGDGGKGRFYSTNELVKFAQKFRLPHNDTWIFSTSASCESLFQYYDDMRETGTATTVINRLDQIISKDEEGKCTKVASLYPHDIFQGDILEGLVIRYVPFRTASTDGTSTTHIDIDEMKQLCTASNELLRIVPPSKTLDRQSSSSTTQVESVEEVDLRALAAMDDFEQHVENVLQRFHGQNIRQIQWLNDTSRDGESTTATKCINVVNVANEILSTSNTQYDQETLAIAKLIQTLDQLKIRVSYRVFVEQIRESKERCICILHIHDDSSFQKYNTFLRKEGRDGLMLFRGFGIELVPTDDDNRSRSSECKSMDLDTAPSAAEEASDMSEEKLMLKMKFLPYMVRTFICRNGLSILQQSGIEAFENHAISQLLSWKVSDESVRKWMPFFKGWARYCSSPPDAGLPSLTNNTYLHYYNKFEEQFASGKFNPPEQQEPSFQGMLVIVGPSKESLENLSLGISKELNCSKIVTEISSITDKDVLLSIQRHGGGFICTAEIEELGRMRKLAKENHEAIYIIMIEGDDVEPSDADDILSRKMKGMRQSWKKTKCNMMLELPKESTMQSDLDTAIEYMHTNDMAKAVLKQLKSCMTKDNGSDQRPGLIVYFPSIPGSGKSSLCQNITSDMLGIGNDRPLVLLEGDQVRTQGKGKFYKVVEKELLKKPYSIAILDKNVPPASFSSIHNLCIESKSVALSILPTGMQDTVVGNEVSSHVYPFSLHYLVVCMNRVLRRQSDSHSGKLDAATENACMVVVKFYCFYRDISTLLLKEKMRNVGYKGTDISVPFFKEDLVLSDLPADLSKVIEDAIILQTQEDMNICKVSNDSMVDMEKHLRSVISSNQVYIDNLTVSLDESKAIFVSELSRVIASLPNILDADMFARESMSSGTIKIASLDLDYEVVHAAITSLRQSCSEVEQYFALREEHKENDENDKNESRFIKSVHCTFAHASQMSQAAMIASFENIMGTKVEIKAISLLFSEDIAAIELEIPNQRDSIPRPRNLFPHITIWCAKDAEAYESNALPEKVNCNQAKKVVFEQPVVMEGIFRFWYY